MTYKELYEKAAAMLDRGEITLGDFNKMVKPLDVEIHPEPHWIPVTDRLPNKEEKSYWVCLEGGGQCQCRWTNNVYGLGANEWSKWGWKKVDLPRYSKVVAYMPLPEPYKGVTT